MIPAGIAHTEHPGNDDGYHALVELGPNMRAPIHHVVVENLRLENGWRNGISFPINQVGGENSDLTIRCNTVRNHDARGIHFASWVMSDPTQPEGWRGGSNFVVASNVVDGTNHYGVFSLAHDSTFQENLITNIGLAENLGKSGLGCNFDEDNCTENGDAMDFQNFDPNIVASANVTIRRNRIERAGYCGLDTFGKKMLLEENVILQACYTKGDCGAIRVFGAKDTTLRRNIVRNVLAPNDGHNSGYKEKFGFGLYVDSGATVRSEYNTVDTTNCYGILYQAAGTSGTVLA